jgi:hypothetical protein
MKPAPICLWGGKRFLERPPMRPSSKVILPYEPGYTGHWEMEKRRKETKEWLRRREQEVRGRLNSPSIVPRQTAGEKVSSD